MRVEASQRLDFAQTVDLLDGVKLLLHPLDCYMFVCVTVYRLNQSVKWSSFDWLFERITTSYWSKTYF